MKTRHFLMMATLAVGMTMTSMMMTSCAKADNPVEELEGAPGAGAPNSGQQGILIGGKDVTVDISEVNTNVIIADGTTLTGKLAGAYKISIEADASITLSDVTIPGGTSYEDYNNYIPWGGLNCIGNATICLKGENNVTGYNGFSSGILVGPVNTTLTIKGDGSLTAKPGFSKKYNNSYAAGIGGCFNMGVGNIRIEGGNITAVGGDGAAGIGCGGTRESSSSCGTITITGGIITAIGGLDAAGIGTGWCYYKENQGIYSTCAGIIIQKPAQGTATGGKNSPFDIGAGYGGLCGVISVEKNTITGNIGRNGGYNTNPNVHPEEGGDNTPVGIPED